MLNFIISEVAKNLVNNSEIVYIKFSFKFTAVARSIKLANVPVAAL